ncbi:trans-2-enoyl-CoA reductase [Aphelenchoides avenae]|nr:trans-2-enoyl-CoA reductase [Aphelenchus avenae]
MTTRPKQVVYRAHGDPPKVLKLEEVALPVERIAEGQVLVRWLAAPVNPTDFNRVENKSGQYSIRFPAVAGVEGCGVVEKLGPGVQGLKNGDLVIPSTPGAGTWATYSVQNSAHLLRIDHDIPAVSASMLLVNGVTAYRLLKDYVDLKPGDGVVQNAANSAVGRLVIQICRIWGVGTVNVIRDRADVHALKSELLELGADVVFTEQEACSLYIGVTLPVPDAIPSLDRIRLALDSVGGASALRLAASLAEGGTLAVYGAISGKNLEINPKDLFYKGIRIPAGFYVYKWTADPANRKELVNTIARLTKWIKSGELKDPPVTKWSLEEIADAIKAAKSGDSRKHVLIISKH